MIFRFEARVSRGGRLAGKLQPCSLLKETGKLPRLPQHLEKRASPRREMSTDFVDGTVSNQSTNSSKEDSKTGRQVAGREEDRETGRQGGRKTRRLGEGLHSPAELYAVSHRIESIAPKPERLTNHPPSDVYWSDHQRLHREKCPITSHHAHPSPHACVKSSLQSQNTLRYTAMRTESLLIVKL